MLRDLARRARELGAQADAYKRELRRLISSLDATLLNEYGVGPISAAKLLAAVTAVGVAHVCLRRVKPDEIWRLINSHGVTHCNAALNVLSGLAHHPDASPVQAPQPLRVGTGRRASGSSAAGSTGRANIEVTTETSGPIGVCDWQPEWDRRDPGERAKLKARQGKVNIHSGELRVIDASGADVIADGTPSARSPCGATTSCVATSATRKRHARRSATTNGSARETSRSCSPTATSSCGTVQGQHVARPPGQSPGGVRGAQAGGWAREEELIRFARDVLPHFKAPRRVLGPLPKSATGKVQKFLLRERVRDAASTD